MAHALRLYPVDDSLPSSAIGIASAALAAGNIVVWFPEHWRSGDVRLLPFHSGVGHVLLVSDVPVLPVFVGGTFEAWPRTQKWPRFRPVGKTCGQLHTLQEMLDGETAPSNPAEAIAEALRIRLIEVAKQVGAEIG